jgi:hypothetical protein
VKECREQSNPWQNFKREDYFLYIIRIRCNQSGRAVNTLSEYVKNEQASEQGEGKVGLFGSTVHGPAGFENDPKNKPVQTKHDKGIKE